MKSKQIQVKFWTYKKRKKIIIIFHDVVVLDTQHVTWVSLIDLVAIIVENSYKANLRFCFILFFIDWAIWRWKALFPIIEKDKFRGVVKLTQFICSQPPTTTFFFFLRGVGKPQAHEIFMRFWCVLLFSYTYRLISW